MHRIKLALLWLALLLGTAPSVEAQGAFVAGSSGSSTFANPVTGNFTIGAQSNRVLAVAILWNDGGANISISSVTWNAGGQTLNVINGCTANILNRKSAFYYVVAPTATTANVAVTFSDSTFVSSAFIIAAEFSGIDQTTPITDCTSATGSASSPTITVSNLTANDMVMDGFMSSAGVTGSTPGANQTAIGSEQAPNDVGWGSYQDGADGGLMDWTTALTGTWINIAARMVAVGGGGGGGSKCRGQMLLGVGC